ncbi:MAG: substrate-binding domain-containing protein, partial [Leptolyngbyaceae bacterium]|nr:substrate-binding domain-containing protein [Leptolyngbyaceae bacterium]
MKQRQILWWGWGLLAVGAIACQPITGVLPGDDANSGDDSDRPDPYVQFTQTVNDVGPMVAPILEEIAQSTSRQQSGFGNQGTVRPQPLPPVNALELYGNIAIATDSELLPLNQALYERFIQAGYSGMMEVKAMGTDTALATFCQGHGVDTLTISRAMTATERTTCRQNGRDVVEFAIGQDALLLVVNPDATFVKGVDLETLAAILTQTTWAEVRAGWPDEPIQRKLIGPDSAAVTLLADTLFSQNPNPILNAPNTDFNNYPEPMLQALSTAEYGVGIVNVSAYGRS